MMMIPETRPSDDCGACLKWKEQGFQECYCFCHKIGNIMNGFHESFNAAIEIPLEQVVEHTVLKWGK